MSEYTDCDYKLSPKTGRSLKFDIDEGIESGVAWKEARGLVSTVNGYVDCFAASYEGEFEFTMLTIIKDGREYQRHFDKEYTVRGMVTKAKQFSRDVFEGS